MERPNLALTFDDILLVPQYSEIVPSSISTRSFFARELYLNAPILSAAMDTVTEHKMARVMAQQGGLGIIHKNLSVEAQALEVEKVKKYESGMIRDPISIGPDQPLVEALEIMRKYSISGLPVTVESKLIGILTNRDLRFERNLNQLVKAVMTSTGLVTAPEGTTLTKAKEILQEHRIEKLPIVDREGKLKGLITVKDIEKSREYPLATKDSDGRLVTGGAVGIDSTSRDRVTALVQAGCDVICVDTAHGHSKNVLEMVRWVRSNYPDVIIVAGNVVTAEATEALIDRGADVVKVGIGPGSICTTRVVTGVGMPQISVVIECSKAAQKLGKTIISDGGIKFSGDITKALAVGASSVMIGNLFAGSDESPGETLLYQGRTYKVYRGMGSLGAMALGSKDRYFQSDVQDIDKLVPEGIEGRAPYRGSTSAIMHQLLGGLKSGMGYMGAATIEDLQRKTVGGNKPCFVQISQAGLRESHVHDVIITKESPNYRLD